MLMSADVVLTKAKPATNVEDQKVGYHGCTFLQSRTSEPNARSIRHPRTSNSASAVYSTHNERTCTKCRRFGSMWLRQRLSAL